jgi:hypothetical protein
VAIVDSLFVMMLLSREAFGTPASRASRCHLLRHLLLMSREQPSQFTTLLFDARQLVSFLNIMAAALVPFITTSLIFGGCCTNVFALEGIVK